MSPEDAEEGNKSPEQAALDEVEPNRLLAGEDESTQHLDDALHWIKVYTELLDFKRKILNTTEDSVETMDPDASQEVTDTDLKALNAEALRFDRRLAYWRRRAAAMGSREEQQR